MPALLLVLALLSVSCWINLRVPKLSNYQPQEAQDVVRHLDSVLTAAGLQRWKTTAVTRNQSYLAIDYRAPLCNGLLRIVPIHRNAEGLGVQQIWARGQTRFFLGGKAYDSFPSQQFYLAKLQTTLAGWLGQARSPAWVYSIYEEGNCQLVEQVPWQDL